MNASWPSEYFRPSDYWPSQREWERSRLHFSSWIKLIQWQTPDGGSSPGGTLCLQRPETVPVSSSSIPSEGEATAAFGPRMSQLGSKSKELLDFLRCRINHQIFTRNRKIFKPLPQRRMQIHFLYFSIYVHLINKLFRIIVRLCCFAFFCGTDYSPACKACTGRDGRPLAHISSAHSDILKG